MSGTTEHPTTAAAAPTVRLVRLADQVQAVCAPGEAPRPARLLRVRPQSDPQGAVSVLDKDKHEIAFLESIAVLDPESRRIAEEELERRYACAVVTRICRSWCENGMRRLHVETERGPRVILFKDPIGQVQRLDDGGLRIRDQAGNRYQIRSLAALSPQCRKLLQRVL